MFVANVYMSLYNRLRVVITADRTETKVREKEMEQMDQEMNGGGDGSRMGNNK